MFLVEKCPKFNCPHGKKKKKHAHVHTHPHTPHSMHTERFLASLSPSTSLAGLRS